MIAWVRWRRPVADSDDEKDAEGPAWVMRRCHVCDVAWAGDQPCWMCGRPGQVRGAAP